MTVKTAAYSAVRWTTAATVSRVLLQTLQLMVLTRLLPPQDFGLMAMITSVTAFIQLFSDLGINNSILQARFITQRVLSTLYWVNLLIGFFLSAAVAAVSPWIAAFYNAQGLETPLMLCALSFTFLALGQQVRVLAEKRLDFRSVAAVEVTSAVVSVIVAIAVAYFGGGVYALVAAVLTLTASNSILYLLFTRNGWYPHLVFNLGEALSHIHKGVLLLGTSIANTATMQLDIIIVGRVLGSTMLGIYSVPRELTLKAMLATNPIITRVGTALIAQAQDDKYFLKRVYLSTIRMTSSINFPLYAFIALFRQDVSLVVFGPNWVATADLLGILALWGMFRSLGNPVGILLYGTGRAWLALQQSIGVMALIIPTVLIGTHWGPQGVGVALTLFYFAFVTVVWAVVVRPMTHASLLEYSEQWLRPFLCTAIACLVASPPLLVELPALVRLALGLATGGIAYLGASWLLNRTWCDAMLTLLNADRLLKRSQ